MMRSTITRRLLRPMVTRPAAFTRTATRPPTNCSILNQQNFSTSRPDCALARNGSFDRPGKCADDLDRRRLHDKLEESRRSLEDNQRLLEKNQRNKERGSLESIAGGLFEVAVGLYIYESCKDIYEIWKEF